MRESDFEIIDLARSLDGQSQADAESLAVWGQDAAAGKLDVIPLDPPLVDAMARPLRKGAPVLVYGPPGSSKSYWISQNVIRWRQQGIRVACRFLEDTIPDYLARCLAQLAGRPEVTDPDWVSRNYGIFNELLGEWRNVLDDVAPCFEADDSGRVSLDDLLRWTVERVHQGYRILVIDPLTAAAGREKPWLVDGQFVRSLKAAISDRASVILISHTTRDGTLAAGGADLARFCPTVLELAPNHEHKAYQVLDTKGRRTRFTPDRLWRVVKARYARGTGARIASRFDPNYLTFNDVGVIIPKRSGDAEADE